MTKEEIKKARLANLADRLAEFWETVESGEFFEGREITVRFSDDDIEQINQELLTAAKEEMDQTSWLLHESVLERSRQDRFVLPFVKKAEAAVEAAYVEACEISGEYFFMTEKDDFIRCLNAAMTPHEASILNMCVFMMPHEDVLDCHRIARERAAAVLQEESYREVLIHTLSQIMVRMVREARVEYARTRAGFPR